MYASWFIAIVVSGGAAMWVFKKMYHNNGNHRDTVIASLVIWVLGFAVLFLIMRSLGI